MIETVSNALNTGGPALWAIFVLSIVLAAVGMWKLSHFIRLGIWQRRSAQAIAATGKARQTGNPTDIRSVVLIRTIAAIEHPNYSHDMAKEECTRIANQQLHAARQGLRLIDLIVTIAPLIGLLGTVLGMIDAFQALQDSGAQADPAALAGGIWEALLTTAAGMAVAIPASVLLSWFDSIIANVQADIEDMATRLFLEQR